jgi:hypothetical protein
MKGAHDVRSVDKGLIARHRRGVDVLRNWVRWTGVHTAQHAFDPTCSRRIRSGYNSTAWCRRIRLREASSECAARTQSEMPEERERENAFLSACLHLTSRSFWPTFSLIITISALRPSISLRPVFWSAVLGCAAAPWACCADPSIFPADVWAILASQHKCEHKIKAMSKVMVEPAVTSKMPVRLPCGCGWAGKRAEGVTRAWELDSCAPLVGGCVLRPFLLREMGLSRFV